MHTAKKARVNQKENDGMKVAPPPSEFTAKWRPHLGLEEQEYADWEIHYTNNANEPCADRSCRICPLVERLRNDPVNENVTKLVIPPRHTKNLTINARRRLLLLWLKSECNREVFLTILNEKGTFLIDVDRRRCNIDSTRFDVLQRFNSDWIGVRERFAIGLNQVMIMNGVIMTWDRVCACVGIGGEDKIWSKTTLLKRKSIEFAPDGRNCWSAAIMRESKIIMAMLDTFKKVTVVRGPGGFGKSHGQIHAAAVRGDLLSAHAPRVEVVRDLFSKFSRIGGELGVELSVNIAGSNPLVQYTNTETTQRLLLNSTYAENLANYFAKEKKTRGVDVTMLLDETGMHNTFDLAKILKAAYRLGVDHLVLIGCEHQIGPFEGGQPFRALVEWLRSGGALAKTPIDLVTVGIVDGKLQLPPRSRCPHESAFEFNQLIYEEFATPEERERATDAFLAKYSEENKQDTRVWVRPWRQFYNEEKLPKLAALLLEIQPDLAAHMAVSGLVAAAQKMDRSFAMVGKLDWMSGSTSSQLAQLRKMTDTRASRGSSDEDKLKCMREGVKEDAAKVREAFFEAYERFGWTAATSTDREATLMAYYIQRTVLGKSDTAEDLLTHTNSKVFYRGELVRYDGRLHLVARDCRAWGGNVMMLCPRYPLMHEGETIVVDDTDSVKKAFSFTTHRFQGAERANTITLDHFYMHPGQDQIDGRNKLNVAGSRRQDNLWMLFINDGYEVIRGYSPGAVADHIRSTVMWSCLSPPLIPSPAPKAGAVSSAPQNA